MGTRPKVCRHHQRVQCLEFCHDLWQECVHGVDARQGYALDVDKVLIPLALEEVNQLLFIAGPIDEEDVGFKVEIDTIKGPFVDKCFLVPPQSFLARLLANLQNNRLAGVELMLFLAVVEVEPDLYNARLLHLLPDLGFELKRQLWEQGERSLKFKTRIGGRGWVFGRRLELRAQGRLLHLGCTRRLGRNGRDFVPHLDCTVRTKKIQSQVEICNRIYHQLTVTGSL